MRVAPKERIKTDVVGGCSVNLIAPTTNPKRRKMEVTECKFYNNGECEYFSEAANDLRVLSHRCCMRIVKPLTQCFYYQPKEKK